MTLCTGELLCEAAEHPRIAEDLLDLVHLYSYPFGISMPP